LSVGRRYAVRDDYYCISRTERGVSVLQHEETGLCPIVERTASSSRQTRNPTPVVFSFSFYSPSAQARVRSRRKPAATSPAQPTASRRSAPCSAPRRRPCPRRVSSRSFARWRRPRR
jgi:hypothetical protein